MTNLAIRRKNETEAGLLCHGNQNHCFNLSLSDKKTVERIAMVRR
jgi:hypothetical protein